VERQFAILPPVIYDEVKHFTPGASIGHGLYKPVHINHTYISTASNKIMEYMAAGLPLLVSDRPGLRQMIETYHCGMVADETDPASIAAAINTLLNNPHQAQAMGDAARRAFEAEFCYERQFAPMGEAFQRLIVA
jgi:glycosyltransferase involved in cell wall biosynthesis